MNYLEFWGEQAVPGSIASRLIAIFEYWRDRYGAELIDHFGTVLLFVVGRPPNNLDDAWNLAVRQRLIAPDTQNSYAIRAVHGRPPAAAMTDEAQRLRRSGRRSLAVPLRDSIGAPAMFAQ